MSKSAAPKTNASASAEAVFVSARLRRVVRLSTRSSPKPCPRSAVLRSRQVTTVPGPEHTASSRKQLRGTSGGAIRQFRIWRMPGAAEGERYHGRDKTRPFGRVLSNTWLVVRTGRYRPACASAAASRADAACRCTLTTDHPPFFLAKPAPNTGILIGVECKLQAVLHTRARSAHLFGGFDLIDR